MYVIYCEQTGEEIETTEWMAEAMLIRTRLEGNDTWEQTYAIRREE